MIMLIPLDLKMDRSVMRKQNHDSCLQSLRMHTTFRPSSHKAVCYDHEPLANCKL